MSKPDNIIRYTVENSPFNGYEIHQWFAVYDVVHDHRPSKVQGDGWESVVVDPDGRKEGPFNFTGDAVAKMKEMAAARLLAELERLVAQAESTVSASDENSSEE